MARGRLLQPEKEGEGGDDAEADVNEDEGRRGRVGLEVGRCRCHTLVPAPLIYRSPTRRLLGLAGRVTGRGQPAPRRLPVHRYSVDPEYTVLCPRSISAGTCLQRAC